MADSSAGAALVGARDTRLAEVVEHGGVPGLSVALLQCGRVAETWTHGVTDLMTQVPVTARTAFRGASLSKHVTAVAVLRMAQERLLDLDADVNGYLSSWQVPATVPGAPAVTLRALLGHMAGLNVQPSQGYPRHHAAPTALDLLLGRPPAVTGPVQRDPQESAAHVYSGNNFTVIQQLLADVTGETFPRLMRHWVVEPLGLSETGFEPDLPGSGPESGSERGPAAVGHQAGGDVYADAQFPALAAGGMWTTPTDMACIEAAVWHAARGGTSPVLGRQAAEAMLTPSAPGAPYGLGTMISGAGPNLRFGHIGDLHGYCAASVVSRATGSGFVVMYNSDDTSLLPVLMGELLACL